MPLVQFVIISSTRLNHCPTLKIVPDLTSYMHVLKMVIYEHSNSMI